MLFRLMLLPSDILIYLQGSQAGVSLTSKALQSDILIYLQGSQASNPKLCSN